MGKQWVMAFPNNLINLLQHPLQDNNDLLVQLIRAIGEMPINGQTVLSTIVIVFVSRQYNRIIKFFESQNERTEEIKNLKQTLNVQQIEINELRAIVEELQESQQENQEVHSVFADRFHVVREILDTMLDMPRYWNQKPSIDKGYLNDL